MKNGKNEEKRKKKNHRKQGNIKVVNSFEIRWVRDFGLSL